VLARLTHFCILKREDAGHTFPISVVVIALRRIALCWCKVYTLSTRGRQAVPFPASGSSPPELKHDISRPRHFPYSTTLLAGDIEIVQRSTTEYMAWISQIVYIATTRDHRGSRMWQDI
jgi:hypothetical protein